MQNIGRSVPLEWVAKDFKIRENFKADPEAFFLVKDHHRILFRSEVECEAILWGGPWFTASQLLAMEPWVAGFVPRKMIMQRTVVWVRLPGLLIEF